MKKQIGIMMWNETKKTSFANKETFQFYFRRESRFHWRGNNSNKDVTVEEELDGIGINGIRNLIGSPGLMFIGEECGNLKVVVNGG